MHGGGKGKVVVCIEIIELPDHDDDGVDDVSEQEVNPDYVLIDDMILSPAQYDVLFTEPSRRNGYTRLDFHVNGRTASIHTHD